MGLFPGPLCTRELTIKTEKEAPIGSYSSSGPFQASDVRCCANLGLLHHKAVLKRLKHLKLTA